MKKVDSIFDITEQGGGEGGMDGGSYMKLILLCVKNGTFQKEINHLNNKALLIKEQKKYTFFRN